jgi:hypothetical protein
VRPSETLRSWLNLRRGQKAPWCPSFSLAVRILILVRFSAAMYSNIQDADEGTRRNLQLETRAHVFSSVQLLGAASLSRSWPWFPDMGDFTGICDSELRVYCFTPHLGEDPPVSLWRPKGMTDGIGRLTADHFCPSESPSLLCAEPFLSHRPYARRNSIGWSLRTSIGVWRDTCFS